MIAWLKADLHTHTREDPKDKFISYSSIDLIDKARMLDFRIIAITPHSGYTYTKDLAKYSKKKGILLISGMEARIEGKDVLVLNINSTEAESINTFEDLRKLRRKNRQMIVIAPHPFYLNTPLNNACLHNKLNENLDLFDAIEYNSFFNKIIDPNRKAIKVARMSNKPVIANSDLHFISDFGRMFSEILIDGNPTAKKLVDAIRKGNVRYVAEPLSVSGSVKMLFQHILTREL